MFPGGVFGLYWTLDYIGLVYRLLCILHSGVALALWSLCYFCSRTTIRLCYISGPLFWGPGCFSWLYCKVLPVLYRPAILYLRVLCHVDSCVSCIVFLVLISLYTLLFSRGVQLPGGGGGVLLVSSFFRLPP